MFIAPRNHRNKIRNSNIEIRNKPKDLNPNYEIRNGLVWNFLIFAHLELFRISDFEFRICSLEPALALRSDLSHFVICLKKPSFSSSFKKRRLTKSSGFLLLTAGTRCATSSMALRMPSILG